MAKRSSKILLGLALILAVVLPQLLGAYKSQVLIFAVTYSMLALAFSLTMKVGLPRFDIAAWWGVGAYTTVMLMWKAHLSFWLTIPIGIAICVVLGIVVFFFSIPRGMMVFMMFGMVFAMAVQQILGTVDFFGGWGGTPSVSPPAIGSLVFVGKKAIYYFGLGLLVFNILVYYLLFKSKIGRAWTAIGSSIRLASSLGIDVVKYRMANVLIGNVFLSLAGSYFAMYSLMVIPNTFGFNNSIYVMMYVVLGGLGYYLVGPIIGALVITILTEGMRVVNEYEPIVTAGLIIVILIFAPGGVVGLLQGKLRPWVTRRRWLTREGPAGGDHVST